MKIQTLLELIDTTTQEKQYRGRFNDKPKNTAPVANEIGLGAYSKVRQHRHDPHMVTKQHHSPKAAKLDKFNQFAKFVIENKLTDNPHFPRLYNVTKITDNKGDYVYKYDIEKLENLYELDKNELFNIYETHFERDSRDMHKISKMTAMDIADQIAYEIEDGIDGTTGIVKSESLAQALSILNKYLREVRYSEDRETINDIHAENVMIRRGKYGYQLVITDPFA